LGCCSDLAAEGIAVVAGLVEVDLVEEADLAGVALVVLAAGVLAAAVQAAAGREEVRGVRGA